MAGPTALHLCFGYAHVVKNRAGRYAFLAELDACRVQQISIEAAQPKLDLDDPQVEAPETVASRLRDALRFVPPHRLIAAPDCGMKYLPRDVAFGKLRALAAGAALVRAELARWRQGEGRR